MVNKNIIRKKMIYIRTISLSFPFSSLSCLLSDDLDDNEEQLEPEEEEEEAPEILPRLLFLIGVLDGSYLE